jgi:hypothetical protein
MAIEKKTTNIDIRIRESVCIDEQAKHEKFSKKYEWKGKTTARERVKITHVSPLSPAIRGF